MSFPDGGSWSTRVVAPSAWRSVAPLRRTPVSKSSLGAYPCVLPRLRRIIVIKASRPSFKVGCLSNLIKLSLANLFDGHLVFACVVEYSLNYVCTLVGR